MKIHKSTYQQMDELFKEARHEKPVMNLKEVEQIVNTGNYIPSGGVRGFHAGMNNLIIISGIVISSLLTYFTLQVDTTAVSPEAIVVSNSVGEAASLQVSTPLKQAVANPSKVRVEPKLKKADKERPALNSAKLMASAKNNAVDENAASENVKTVSISKKMSFVGFTVEIVDNDDIIDMTLNDGDVTMLAINHKIVPKDKYSDYDEVISQGKVYAAGLNSGTKENYSFGLIGYFDSVLHADKILTSNSPYLFELTSSQLLINKQAQSDIAFEKYKRLYEDKTGKVVTEGSVYRFENGVKSE